MGIFPQDDPVHDCSTGTPINDCRYCEIIRQRGKAMSAEKKLAAAAARAEEAERNLRIALDRLQIMGVQKTVIERDRDDAYKAIALLVGLGQRITPDAHWTDAWQKTVRDTIRQAMDTFDDLGQRKKED